jgi:hypothetical protein
VVQDCKYQVSLVDSDDISVSSYSSVARSIRSFLATDSLLHCDSYNPFFLCQDYMPIRVTNTRRCHDRKIVPWMLHRTDGSVALFIPHTSDCSLPY